MSYGSTYDLLLIIKTKNFFPSANKPLSETVMDRPRDTLLRCIISFHKAFKLDMQKLAHEGDIWYVFREFKACRLM